MDEYTVAKSNEWDMTAFIPNQRSMNPRSRPVDTMFQGDELANITVQNGMDIFTTPPFARAQDERFCTRVNIDSRLRFLNQVSSIFIHVSSKQYLCLGLVPL